VRETLVQYWRYYLTEFVGQLGWLDVALPRGYHAAAHVMLGIAALAAMLGLRGERISASSCSIIASGFDGFGGWIICNPVHDVDCTGPCDCGRAFTADIFFHLRWLVQDCYPRSETSG